MYIDLDDAKAYLAVQDTASDDLITAILLSVEEQFHADCNRRDRPFIQTEQTDRIEVKPGTGSSYLYLDYPIKELKIAAIGYAGHNPRILPDSAISWTTGLRAVARIDGGLWGSKDLPNYLRITYDALPDAPALVRIAILRAVAALYRQIGAEDTTRERLSSYERDLRQVYSGDQVWLSAVKAEYEARV